MPTVIHFGEGNLPLTVAEEPDQVGEAYVQADGRPFTLNGKSVRGEVYIDPARVSNLTDTEFRQDRDLLIPALRADLPPLVARRRDTLPSPRAAITLSSGPAA